MAVELDGIKIIGMKTIPNLSKDYIVEAYNESHKTHFTSLPCKDHKNCNHNAQKDFKQFDTFSCQGTLLFNTIAGYSGIAQK